MNINIGLITMGTSYIGTHPGKQKRSKTKGGGSGRKRMARKQTTKKMEHLKKWVIRNVMITLIIRV